MVLGLLQKQHDLSLLQFLFAKLSLVSITLLLKNQIKILIFKGIFNRQTICETRLGIGFSAVGFLIKYPPIT
jgi:hypothetical protein